MPMRTGYERAVPLRTGITSDLWSKVAQDDGEVVSIKGGVMTVKYANGKVDAVELGIRHGTWAGKTVPHEVITDHKVGDKIIKGKVISYNKNWYKPDSLYPDQVILSMATLARTVIWESDATFEDSSSISESLAKRLETRFSFPRVVSIPFDHEVRDLVEIGDVVGADDLACVLYPPMSVDASDRHNEVARDILERLRDKSPRMKKKGTVTAIKVRYSGEMEDMSESVRELVEHHDGILARKRKQMQLPIVDGSIEPNVRMNGTEIGTNTVNIEIMVDYDLAASGGDKVVWGHQLKSVPCEVFTGRLETLSGVKIDGIFGALSIEDRMVRSCYIMGTTNRLLSKTGEDACDIFFRNALKK